MCQDPSKSKFTMADQYISKTPSRSSENSTKASLAKWAAEQNQDAKLSRKFPGKNLWVNRNRWNKMLSTRWRVNIETVFLLEPVMTYTASETCKKIMKLKINKQKVMLIKVCKVLSSKSRFCCRILWFSKTRVKTIVMCKVQVRNQTIFHSIIKHQKRRMTHFRLLLMIKQMRSPLRNQILKVNQNPSTPDHQIQLRLSLSKNRKTLSKRICLRKSKIYTTSVSPLALIQR